VVVEGHYDEAAGLIELSIENPLPGELTPDAGHRQGNRIALDNLRQRFALAWGKRASVDAGPHGDRYRVKLKFPAELA
jgi:two-component system sensor histidine kinase AlgZ